MGLMASVPPQDGSTYAWTIDNGTITAGDATRQITFTAGVSGSVQLACTVTSAAGASSAQGTATLNILPVITAFQTSATVLNPGSASILSFSFQGLSGAITATNTSTNTSTLTQVASGGSLNVTPSADTTYTLMVTNPAGFQTQASILVQVVPAPVITAFSASSKRVFPGGSTQLTADFSGGAATVDQGVGSMTSGAGRWSPALSSGATFTLNVNSPAGSQASSQAEVAVFQSLVTAAGIPGVLPPVASHGVAVDGSGNVFVADSSNNTILRFTSATAGSATSWSMTTIAGTAGVAGSSDGQGTEATFNGPTGIAVDPWGKLYVADSGNRLLRLLTPSGTGSGATWTVSTLAGDTGNPNGQGGNPVFAYPCGVAVDGSGNVFVADGGKSTISLLTPVASGGATVGSATSWSMTTIAGTAGVAGSSDGQGAGATFNGPTGIAVDPWGKLYVADSGNRLLRLLTPSGTGSGATWTVSTLALTGNAPGAPFSNLQSIAADGSGHLYVADAGSNTVSLLTPSTGGGAVTWNVTVLAGTSGVVGNLDGPGASATFNAPFGVAVGASGNLLVADTGNSSLRLITPSQTGGTMAWTVSTVAGTAWTAGSADGPGAGAAFFNPAGLAVDASGKVYVADSANSAIRLLTPSTGGALAWDVSTLAGTAGVTGNADGPGSAATFNSPTSVAVDGSGNVFVADPGNKAIRQLSPAVTNGVTTWTVSSLTFSGMAPAFSAPSGLAMDGSGNLYVADAGDSTIRLLTPIRTGGRTVWTATLLAGTAGTFGHTDGPGFAATFDTPVALAVDASGNLFVADGGNNTIRLLRPTAFGGVTAWNVTTIAGKAGVAGTANGPGPQATFNSPTALVVDPSGYVFVADSGNNIIRMLTAPAGGTGTWTVSTAAGPGGALDKVLPPLSLLSGLALDPATGGLFFSSPNAILEVW
jgi:secreted PhoX family phosphatase